MKKAIFTLQNGGGSYQVKIIGDPKKENWGKIDDEIIFDYQKDAVETDLKNDGYKIINQ